MIRHASQRDIAAVARLLHEFNSEFHQPSPGVPWLAERVQSLLEEDVQVLVAGDTAPVGVVVMRFREALWSTGQECYLAELYVTPDERGHGHGRRLMLAAMQVARQRGAVTMDLGTAHDDVAARSLYESLGFRNTDSPTGGSVNYFYEREL